MRRAAAARRLLARPSLVRSSAVRRSPVSSGRAGLTATPSTADPLHGCSLRRMTRRLWAPWRLEYVQSADERPGASSATRSRAIRRSASSFGAANAPSSSSTGSRTRRATRWWRRPATSATSPSSTDDEALEIHRLAVGGRRGAARDLRAGGVQPRLEPRPRRRSRRRRPRPPARRAALGAATRTSCPCWPTSACCPSTSNARASASPRLWRDVATGRVGGE